VQEEYTYFTQAQFERLFADLGLRILASTPLHNPWIVRHRFEGRFELRRLDGAPLGTPATNYIIVGERAPADEGVRTSVRRVERPPRFLRLEHHRHRPSGRVFDLAARPHPTLDIVPYFFEGDTVHVLARTSYPRPILGAAEGEGPLDGSGIAHYVTEPLNVIQTDAPVGQTVEERLERAAGLAPSRIRRMRAGTTYYPSPGGILEEVRSVLVEIEPQYVNTPLEGVSGFSTSGRVRAIEARQLLRAAQVGGLPDARLELNVHDLLLQLGAPPGPWIGDELPREGTIVEPTPLAALLSRPGRRLFERAPAADSPGFLEVRCAAFDEHAADGKVLASRSLEYVVPRPRGCNTIAAALLARDRQGRLLMGIDEDDLPAAQSFSGNSNILVAPAWRVPRAVQTMMEARAFVLERLRAEYGLEAGDWCALGGAYRPSPGLTPEVVFPLAFAVKAIEPAGRALAWVPLVELVEGRQRIPDGHLRILALRSAHAAG
jgi:hypothetical protein